MRQRVLMSIHKGLGSFDFDELALQVESTGEEGHPGKLHSQRVENMTHRRTKLNHRDYQVIIPPLIRLKFIFSTRLECSFQPEGD
jgi:hypothetical protein